MLTGCGGGKDVISCPNGEFSTVDTHLSFVEKLPNDAEISVKIIEKSSNKAISDAKSTLACDAIRNECSGKIDTSMAKPGQYRLAAIKKDGSSLGSVDVEIKASNISSCTSGLQATISRSIPPTFDETTINKTLGMLDGIINDVLTRTGVPGMAVGVVYQDKVVYAKGFGVRETGKAGAVDPDTVFQLASLSKPIASTIVAKLVGDGALNWNDPAKKYNPAFALSNPYVTENATIGNLLSHRSGLYTGAGDLLEDLGFDQAYILAHINQQPLDTFRTSYHYSNFGYTLGGVSAADAVNKSWEQLADEALFKPAAMPSSSYRHADYLSHVDRARIHVRLPDGTWAAKYDRQPDAEAPAGGASSTLNDMLRFVRLQLGDGMLEGKQIIDASALAQTRIPALANAEPLYGFGWNIKYDDAGRVQISHSGAFNLGTATNVLIRPSDELGIVTLTNGEPIGAAEAIAATFLDIAQNGKQTVDWVSFLGAIFEQMRADEAPKVDYSKRPVNPRPAQPLDAYTGTCRNSYYGPLNISLNANALSMKLGSTEALTTFALRHFDGDTFSFESIRENGNGLAGAIFTMDNYGKAAKVVLDFYDTRGLGTFICD
jgi:CubicO group peptidase (beta-lactamase class C family)